MLRYLTSSLIPKGRNYVLLAAVAAVGAGAVSCKTAAPQDSEVKQGKQPDPAVAAIVETDLGEHAWPGETEANNDIIAATMKTVQKKYDAGGRPARRDAHPKHHGCVRASFDVNPVLPDGYARGVIQPGAHYNSWIRFSNGSSDTERADIEGDGRGMAIKLVGVTGDKILPDEINAQTQDFLMINHPVFFASDPAHYNKIVEAAGDDNKLKALFNAGFSGAKVIFDLQKIKIANPLEAQYFSMVPYKFGVGPEADAIKFSARPCFEGTTQIPRNPTKDYLREAMATSLRKPVPTCFEFLIQKRGGADISTVEDPTQKWDDKTSSPFVKVATITVQPQEFISKNQQSFCENLSYTPWHSLPEHKPLGGVNRTRRVVYKAVSDLRHRLNGPRSVEPTGNEQF